MVARMSGRAASVNENGVVEISYEALLNNEPTDLSPSIVQAFGSDPECLGLIIVKDLPHQYKELRSTFLRLIDRFAHLDEDERNKYSDASSYYRYAYRLPFIQDINN